MADDTKLYRLIQLIQKIAQNRRHVRLEIEWNGHAFRWNVVIGGMLANEWSPVEQPSSTTTSSGSVDIGSRKH